VFLGHGGSKSIPEAKIVNLAGFPNLPASYPFKKILPLNVHDCHYRRDFPMGFLGDRRAIRLKESVIKLLVAFTTNSVG
jgi:hypothetical protein